MRWWALELDGGYEEPFHDYTLGCQCPDCRGISAAKCVSAGEKSTSRRKASVRGLLSPLSQLNYAAQINMGRASICPACGRFTTREEGMCSSCEKSR